MSQSTLARVAPRGATARTGRAGSARSAPGTRQARLRLVDAAPSRQGNTGFALLCIGLVLGGLMCALMLNMARGEGSFTLGALRAEQTRLHDERVTLEAQLADLRSPDTLADKAKDLGLVPSPSTAVLRLSDGAVLGVAAGVDGNDTFTVETSSGAAEDSSATEVEEDGVASEDGADDASEEG